MAEKSTIARPYAQAVFKLAEEQQQLPKWSETLTLLAAIVEDPAMGALIGNPRVSHEQLHDVICGVGGERLDDRARSLIDLLIENDRIALLPEIAALYERYRAEAEHVVKAEVISAYKVSADQEKAIARALKARLGKEVAVSSRIDKSLIGGAIIRAGDMVIDGSVTGHLDRLGTALSQ